jgi:asparagine synthase (glutamine-hydrolysing)
VLNKDLNLTNSINFNNKFITLNRECNLKHWNSHFDHKSKIQLIILGRPVIEVLDWAKFDKSEESFITKFLIKKYIDLEINDFCNQLNGAFSILVIDYKFNKLSIITDKLGIYPIYTYGIDNINSFQFSSNFKTLLDNINNKVHKDIVSIAEFLKKGFIYHPNTFYTEIKTLDNGSYCILDFNEKKIIKKKYFQIKAKPIYNFDYLVNELSKVLSKSIERRTLNHFGKKAVFLSGGTDSRMILANSADFNTDALTLYNQENHEIKITKNIAQSLNAKHELIKRDENYYLNSFDSSIQANSGRSLPIDDHFLNLKNNEKIKKYDTILTGCYADWLFKGIALDRTQLSFSFIGKLPLYKLKAFNYNFFAKRTLLKKKYEKMIREREDQIFSDKESHLNNEIVRIFPLFQEETSATRMTLQQFFPWDSIFSDNDVIKVYQQIPAKYKINSEVYDRAVSNILNKGKNIPHANKKHKIGINKYYGAIIYILSMIKNKILKLIKIKKTNLVAGDGSWINFKEYTNNEQIKKLWENSQNLKLLKEMLPSNKLEFKEIINNDYKLIYKCIVLDKILYQRKDKQDD